MLRLRGSVTVDAVDTELLQSVVEHALDRWRDLRFEGGAVVDPTTGARRQGLRVTDGRHPDEGVTYAVASSEPALATGSHTAPVGVAPTDARPSSSPTDPVWRTSTIEVTTDRPRGIEVQVHQSAEVPVDASIEITPRDRPEHLEARVTARLTGHWATRGRLRIDVDGDLGRTGTGSARTATIAPTLVATASHRRGRGRAEVSITTVSAERWEVTVAVRANGRGLFRPLVAVAVPFGRKAIRAGFLEALDGATAHVAAFNASLRTTDGHPRTADDLAEELVTEAIRAVPETIPEGI